MFAIQIPAELTMETLVVKNHLLWAQFSPLSVLSQTFSFSNPIYADYYPSFISLSWLPDGVHIVVVYV